MRAGNVIGGGNWAPYKGEIVKDYFLKYHSLNSDISVHIATGQASYVNTHSEDWIIHMIDTGQNTLTGGRLHRLENLLRPHGTFMLTYGDGVSSVDIRALVDFHRQHGKLATVTAVRPPARFGEIVLDENQVVDFHEKPQIGEGWINGGFFVFEPGVFDYLHGDQIELEKEPLENLVSDGQLIAFKHYDFWYPMDTVRDRNYLNNEWIKGTAQWKVWED